MTCVGAPLPHGLNIPVPYASDWYRCSCGQKLFRIDKDAHASGVYVWCKKCKREVPVNF